MDLKRAYLKELAARSSDRWSSTPLPPALAGETRIETRNTVYELVDGVCCGVRRQQTGDPRQMPPSAYLGMRMVGWLKREDPQGGVTQAWTPGAYAVLWRPRVDGEEHSAVALTSTSQAFRQLSQQRVAPSRPVRPSAPPLLPRPPARSGIAPLAPRPPSWIPPAPPSMTRLLPSTAPPAPETPTPVRRPSSSPPPLPARARAPKSLVQRVPMAS